MLTETEPVSQVELFNAVDQNCYKIVYLSARAIGQVRLYCSVYRALATMDTCT